MDIRFQVTGGREVEQALHGMDELAGDLRPAFREITEWFHRRQQGRFSSRGDGLWKPLKAKTVKRKGNAKVLVDTGRLLRSLTSRASGSVAEIKRDSMEVGTKVPYAKYQDRRRKLIRVRPTDRRDVMSIITDHILGDV